MPGNKVPYSERAYVLVNGKFKCTYINAFITSMNLHGSSKSSFNVNQIKITSFYQKLISFYAFLIKVFKIMILPLITGLPHLISFER